MTEARSIQLKFNGSGGEGVEFKLSVSMRLEKAMNAYSARVQRPVDQLRFLFDGERLQADDTPETREMDDGDVVDVHMEQLGGADEFEDWEDWENVETLREENLKLMKELERVSATNADLRAKNLEFAQEHTTLKARNQELLKESAELQKAVTERLGKIQVLRRRIEPSSKQTRILFMMIDGCKWESRWYKFNSNAIMKEIFETYARYEKVDVNRITFTSKDRLTAYHGYQTVAEAGLGNAAMIRAYLD